MPKTKIKSYKQQYKEAMEEIEALKERLNLDNDFHTEESWMMLPVDQRTRFASRSLLQAWGLHKTALRRIGFDVDRMDTPTFERIRALVFETEEVKAAMAVNLAEVENARQAIVARQAEIALNGTDGESIRAAQFCARVGGWEKNNGSPSTNVTINLAQLVEGRDGVKRMETIVQTQDPLELLSHEPGEPVRVSLDDDDAIKAALEESH
jgi:hypothetical protein